MLDQRRLPAEEFFYQFNDYRQTALAIRAMVTRGAPAIGIAAAAAFCQAFLPAPAQGGDNGFTPLPDDNAPAPFVEEAPTALDEASFLKAAQEYAGRIKVFIDKMRPTAVNLFWATERMVREVNDAAENGLNSPGTDTKAHLQKLFDGLFAVWSDLDRQDEFMCDQMADAAYSWLSELSPEVNSWRVLTHCNTGTLATGGIGTALGVVYRLFEKQKLQTVWVDETRPYLQGARLTAWELERSAIPHKIISDNMAGWLMAQGKVDLIVTGADRIAKNGDTANKIGTYSLSVLAKEHNLPFVVVAPVYSMDFTLATGAGIQIEERSAAEVLEIGGTRIGPAGSDAYHPAFDITPAKNITAIVSELGVLKPDEIHTWQNLAPV